MVLCWVLAVAGCGHDAVTTTPAVVAPIPTPANFKVFRGQGFTIAAPETFTPQNQRSTNGEPKLTLNGRPLKIGAEPILVAVIRDVKPEAPVAEQMRILEEVKHQVSATEITRQEVHWPHAKFAMVVGWTQRKSEPPRPPGPPVHTLQLAIQVEDNLIIDVVATAPAESFDDTEVATVLRTFRLT